MMQASEKLMQGKSVSYDYSFATTRTTNGDGDLVDSEHLSKYREKNDSDSDADDFSDDDDHNDLTNVD